MKGSIEIVALRPADAYDPIPGCRACGEVGRITHRIIVRTPGFGRVERDCCSRECAEALVVRWSVEDSSP